METEPFHLCNFQKLARSAGPAYASIEMKSTWLLLSAGVLLAGCARGESAADRQIDQLRDGLNGVQADHERMDERMGGPIDTERDGRLEKTPPPTTGTKKVTAPDTKATRIAPDGSEQEQTSGETAAASDDPDDATPRPKISVQGFAPPSGRKGTRTPARIEATNLDDDGSGAAPSPSAPKSSVLDPEAKKSYDAALALVNSKQYTKALEALAAFLVKWPDHPYADNAMYWRGESYYAQGDYAHAAEQLEGLLARFPAGNKVPDALLKLGMCQQKLGNKEKAKSYFDRLAREFPRSEAARRIPSDGPARREVNP
jgi:tol-pal system protein YbgF